MGLPFIGKFTRRIFWLAHFHPYLIVLLVICIVLLVIFICTLLTSVVTDHTPVEIYHTVAVKACLPLSIRSITVHRDGYHTIQSPKINATFAHSRIPKVVHYLYANHIVPNNYAQLIFACMKINPDIRFVLWSDKTAEEFMKRYFPPTVFAYYQALPRVIMKTDMLRIAILYQLGGIYLDMDMECRKPFDQFFHEQFPSWQPAQCILDREVSVQTQIIHSRPYAVMNNLIICEPHHPFLRHILEHFPSLEGRGIISNGDILEITGPMFLSQTLEDYRKTDIAVKRPVMDAKSQWFSPWVENFLLSDCLESNFRSSSLWRLWGCARVVLYIKQKEANLHNAYLIHRFLHYGYRPYYFTTMENMCNKKVVGSDVIHEILFL